MTWVKFDDRFPKHRKVVKLSDRAFRLHVSAICHCAEELTDGKVKPRDLAMVAASIEAKRPSTLVRELIDARLWLEMDDPLDGFEIKDYLEYNPSREKVLDERARAAERERERRAARDGARVGPRS